MTHPPEQHNYYRGIGQFLVKLSNSSFVKRRRGWLS